MLDRLFISETLPRDLSTFGATLSEGLGVYKLYSYGLLSVGALLLVFCIVKIRFPFPYILAIAILIIGLLFRYHINKTVKVRDICYHQGKAIKAEVISHHRTMSIFNTNKKTAFPSPRKDYTIKVEFEDGNGKTRTKDLHYKEDLIWKTHPVGAELIGLVYEDKSLFAEEMGATFHFFHKKN